MRARRARCADLKDRGIGRRASEDSDGDYTLETFLTYEMMNICYGVFVGELYHLTEHTFVCQLGLFSLLALDQCGLFEFIAPIEFF